MSKNINYYDKLGLSPSASQEEIRHAYRKTLLKVHPDVNSKEGATEFFLDIQKAYTVLSNPTAKTAYDTQETTLAGHPLVDIQTLYSCGALRRLEEPQLIYALIDITTTSKADPYQKGLPLNLVLLLDLSNSMKGPRLNTLKAATIDIIQELDSQDSLSVIAFNDRAKVILSSRDHLQKRLVESKINALTAKGGTEIHHGLEAAFKRITHDFAAGQAHHILMITDGHTYGDEDACLELAKKAASRDIGISGFGIGSEWNDKFLDEMTALTGGSSIYIQEPQQIKEFLEEKMRHLSKIYAKNVLLDIKPAPKVTLESAFRLFPEAGLLPNSPPYSLGALRHLTTQRILLEFLVEPIPSGIDTAVLANGEFTLKLRAKEIQLPVILKRSMVPSETVLEPPPPEIMQAMSHLTLYRMQEKAHLDMAQGNHQVAIQRMKDLATHLLANEELSLGKDALKEASHIEAHLKFSTDGPKILKYGTRRLLLPSKQP